MAWKPKEANALPLKISEGFDETSFFEGVLKNDYILVVGSEVILDPLQFPDSGGDVLKYLLDCINISYHRSYKSISEAEKHEDKPLYKVLSEQDYTVADMSPELVELLRSKYFKFVFTTTPDHYIETLMTEIFGNDLRVVNIRDYQSLEDFKEALVADNNYSQPTIFYVFGKYLETRNRVTDFVATDEDAIIFIEKWLKDLPLKGNTNYIESFLKQKRIIGIGCNFEDWYYRFFWYILTREFRNPIRGNVSRLDNAVIKSNEQNLEEYLNYLRVCIHTDSWSVLRYLCQMLKKKEGEDSYADLINKKKLEGRVFISYKNDPDFSVAFKLVESLKAISNFKIWFDSSCILGGQQYNKHIPGAIRFARVFIPLLTPSISEILSQFTMSELLSMNADDDIPYYFLKEWLWAKESKGISIIPVALMGYNVRGEAHKKFESLMFGDNSINATSSITITSLDDSKQLGFLVSSITKNLELK